MDVEAMVYDTEEDPLTTDIPLYVIFVNACLCAQAMGTEGVEAMVEDMEDDHCPQIFLRLYYL
jgi:hypothetical protein